MRLAIAANEAGGPEHNGQSLCYVQTSNMKGAADTPIGAHRYIYLVVQDGNGTTLINVSTGEGEPSNGLHISTRHIGVGGYDIVALLAERHDPRLKQNMWELVEHPA